MAIDEGDMMDIAHIRPLADGSLEIGRAADTGDGTWVISFEIMAAGPEAEAIARDLQTRDETLSAEQSDLIDPEIARDVTRDARRAAYLSEADPLAFQMLRGEATPAQYAAKVAEIRARHPYPEEKL